MKQTNIEDYLNAGMYGAPEIKAEEKKLFLGTMRERVEVALTNGQVMEATLYSEVTTALTKKKNVKLLLNGDITYSYLSKYIQIANKNNIPFALINQNDKKTPIGLVVTHSKAVDKESIYVKDAIYQQSGL